MKLNAARTIVSTLVAQNRRKKMRTFFLASAAVLVLSQAAMAQTGTTQTPANPAPMAAAGANPAAGQHMRANLRSMLEKAGFSEIRVAPTSFVIHAKDTEGNPVVMSVSPDSFTEVTDLNEASGPTTGSATANPASGQFVSVPANDELNSKLVGLDIYNNDQKDIGQIKDVAMNQNGRSQAYIVSVGGFLGIGEHYVAVSPSTVKVTYNDTDKKWHASMNATADQLKAAPEFKYTGRWEANRT
jgi:sporulation protein YlmC with PRC-barrel domain